MMLSTRSGAVFNLIFCALLESVLADGHNPMSAPAAGDIIITGQPYTIKWSPGTSGAVSIYILDDVEQTWKSAITTSTSNTGSFVWTPDPDLATRNSGTDYFLSICSISSGDCTYTYAGRFSLVQGQSSSGYTISAVVSSTTGGLSTVLSVSTTPTTLINVQSSTSSSSQAGFSSRVSPTDTISSLTSVSFPTSQTTRSSTLTASTSNMASTLGYTSSNSAATPLSSSPTSSTASSDRSGGLSNTAKIAIGVLASVLGTALFLVGGYLLYSKRQRARDTPCAYHDKPELDTVEKQKNFCEMSGHDANAIPYVYSAKVHELDAGRTGVIQYEKS